VPHVRKRHATYDLRYHDLDGRRRPPPVGDEFISGDLYSSQSDVEGPGGVDPNPGACSCGCGCDVFVPCDIEVFREGTNAVAALLGNGGGYPPPSVSASHTGDVPPGGWSNLFTVGPLLPTNGADASIEVLENNVVRVFGDAWVNTVLADSTGVFTLDLLINGVVARTESVSKVQVGAGGWVQQVPYDWPDVPVSAGDLLQLRGTPTNFLAGGWGGFGAGAWRGHMVVAHGPVTIPQGYWAGAQVGSVELVTEYAECQPDPGLEHYEETVGDGVATEFLTNYPYSPLSLEVHVDGLLWPVTETEPEAGRFTFSEEPPSGAVIILRYRNADVISTGAGNTVPVASAPAGGSGGGGGTPPQVEEFTALGGLPETFTLTYNPTAEPRVHLNGSLLPAADVVWAGMSVGIDTVAGDAVTVEYSASMGAVSPVVSITWPLGGSGVPVLAGSKGLLQVPFNCTVVAARLVGDAVGNLVVDVRKATYAGLFATASICGGAKPTLAGAQKSEDTVLTGWSPAIVAGDWLEFVVEGTTTGVTRATLAMEALRI